MAQDEPRADKRLKSESSRTQVLGDNPNEARDRARRLLEPGYYVSASGRSATRILHFLGDRYMIPGIDYFRYQYVEQLMPSIFEYDGVCKLCPYGFMSPAERRLRLQCRRERSERNWNLALAKRREAWKDRFSVVQVNQLSVLTCSIPGGFLSWDEGRACTVLQGLSTNGQNSLP